MRRRAMWISLLISLACMSCGQYDINSPLLSDVVKLPYHQALNKGRLWLTIEPISGRADAVRVIAKMQGFYESPTAEWTQDSRSVKRLSLDGGLECYDIEFLEFGSGGEAVSEVRISVVGRSKSGPR